jgi:hypothetical protein
MNGADKGCLERLRAFSAVFEREGFEFGKYIAPESDHAAGLTTPYWNYSAEAERFIQACYDDGWVRPTFDWAEWTSSGEAAELRNIPSVLAVATPDQLAKLLTTLIWQDRFAEGHMAAAFESGLFRLIVRRARALAHAI